MIMENFRQNNSAECKQEQIQKSGFSLELNTSQYNDPEIVKKEESNTDVIIHKKGDTFSSILREFQAIPPANLPWFCTTMVIRVRLAEAKSQQQRIQLKLERMRLEKEREKLRLKEKKVEKILERRLTRLTDQEKKSIVSDYLPFDKNISKLAKKYRVSRVTIKNYLRKAGFQ